MIKARVVDICQRVFGAAAQVDVVVSDDRVQVVVKPKNRQDPLTQSQQEMDVIMSLQHLLQGAAVQLDVQ